MVPESCFLCRKHRSLEAAPPGGYIYQDERWLVCHAPVSKGPLGTLFIEARRHVLDFGELDDGEASSFGALARNVYAVLRPLAGAERIYQVSMMEGIDHFHAWIIPRTADMVERGVGFLAKDLMCRSEDAERLVVQMREAAQKW